MSHSQRCKNSKLVSLRHIISAILYLSLSALDDISVPSRYFSMKDFENVLVCSVKKEKCIICHKSIQKKYLYFIIFLEIDVIFSEQT